MNIVVLKGRLTRDAEVRETASGMKVARYTLAVDRPRRAEEGEQNADFIGCVTFGKNAEFAERFLHKGTMIAIEGRIQTGSYDKEDGTRVYTTDVVVNRHEFCESRNASAASAQQQDNSFVNVPEGSSEELPFA